MKNSNLFPFGVIVLWGLLLFSAVGCTEERGSQVSLEESSAKSRECVVLLHGLARSPGSMEKLEKHLERAGYRVFNLGYPSRKYPIEKLGPIVEKKMDEQSWRRKSRRKGEAPCSTFPFRRDETSYF